MEIQAGVQPNCSELVMYIDDYTTEEVAEILAQHKIYEYAVNNFYSYDKEAVGDWDGEKPAMQFIKIDGTNKIIRKWIKQYDYGTDKEQEEAAKELEKLGFNPWHGNVQLIKENAEPDWENCASASLEDSFDSHDGPAIRAHQHCQTQNFPLLFKISSIFDVEVMGYDGGSNEQYNQWVEDGCPDPKTWEF